MNLKPIYRHAEMKWPEFSKFIKKTDFAILPVGSLEQHGPHLPFNTDVLIAEYLAEHLEGNRCLANGISEICT